MIKVTIELYPGGDTEAKPKHLGTAIINNDLADTLESGGRLGSYKVKLSQWNPNRIWKRGSVQGFDRQARGPYDLLFLALLGTVGSRNRRQIKAFLEPGPKK